MKAMEKQQLDDLLPRLTSLHTLNTLTITINNETDIDVANSIIERIYKLC